MNKQEFNAGKKAYQQPSMKVIEIESNDIICTSTTSMSLFDEEVDNSQQGITPSSIWGTQW